MSKLIEKVKENKKVHDAKIEAAAKMADEAAKEFAEVYESLIKQSSEEEFKEFIQDKEFFKDDFELKLLTIVMFCESHDVDMMALKLNEQLVKEENEWL